MHGVVAMAVTVGWLGALAAGLVGLAKAVGPAGPAAGRRLVFGVGEWAAIAVMGLFLLLALTEFGLVPEPGEPLRLVQQVMWLVVWLAIAWTVRRIRSLAYSDQVLAAILPELLVLIAVAQRASSDEGVGRLLEQARAAAGEGRSRRALAHLLQASALLPPGGEEDAELRSWLTRLAQLHGVTAPRQHS